MGLSRTIAGSIAKLPITMALCLSTASLLPQAAQPATNAPTAQRSPLTARDWWRNAVIYQVYPRSFQDTNGDGIGDLNGIIEHLDYLQKLGVDAIWLTPVYPSPNYDFGYDVSNYIDINPEYGTLADFDRLMAEANKRHIRVIMDIVMNHTSDQHPWFLQSRLSRDNPYRDWYVWREGRGETSNTQGGPPNNWGGFGRSPWEWDQKTRQYYYHHFSIHQPDLNWYNPAVKQAFKDAIGFWLKRGVAGYRFDAIGTLFEDPTYSDEEVAKNKDGKPILDVNGKPVFERVKEGNLPAVHTVMNEMHTFIHGFDTPTYPGFRVLIGETNTRSLDDLIKWYGTAAKPEFDLPMNMQVGFINKLDVAAFRERIVDGETAIGNHVPLLVFDNHDRPRIDARYGDGIHDLAIQRIIATILFASGGATLMYYGDEIGMVTTPPSRKEDVKDLMEGSNWPTNKGRDGERTPMQWDSSLNAGFTTGTPWLPVPPSAKQINVNAEERDPSSLLAWYRALIKLKKTNPVLAEGTDAILDTTNNKVLSWSRQLPGVPTVVVSVNFTSEPQVVNLTSDNAGLTAAHVHTLLKSPGVAEPVSVNQIELGPYSVYIGEMK